MNERTHTVELQLGSRSTRWSWRGSLAFRSPRPLSPTGRVLISLRPLDSHLAGPISSVLVQTPNSSVPHYAGPSGPLHGGHLWPVRSHGLDWNRPLVFCHILRWRRGKEESRKAQRDRSWGKGPGAGRPDRGDGSEGKEGELGNGPWSGA